MRLKKEEHKKDICLAAAVLAAAIVLLFIYRGRSGENGEENGSTVEITVDGEVYGTYPLDAEREIDVLTDYGRNTVVIQGGRAYMKEADCPDKICEGMREIARDGESICCLPHRLFLTVRNKEAADYDAVT